MCVSSSGVINSKPILVAISMTCSLPALTWWQYRQPWRHPSLFPTIWTWPYATELKDSPYSRAMWDNSFQALYKITLDKSSLFTELKITNTDNKPFSFTTALHTYFSASVSGASVRGLKGCKTLKVD